MIWEWNVTLCRATTFFPPQKQGKTANHYAEINIVHVFRDGFGTFGLPQTLARQKNLIQRSIIIDV